MWTKGIDFDGASRNPFCSCCGGPRKKDPLIFRLGDIEMEGSFDVCAQCVRDMARKHLSMYVPEDYEALAEELEVLQDSTGYLYNQMEEQERQIKLLKMENFELLKELSEYE